LRQTPPCELVGEGLGDGAGEPGEGGGEGWPGRDGLTIGPGLGERADDGPGLAPVTRPGVAPADRRDELAGPPPASRETDAGPTPPGPAGEVLSARGAGAADTPCGAGAAAGDSGPMRIDTVTKRA
jgi:hypothetical protein